ncbi:MAG: stage II sporulation protein R [bacterium]|nr:stage II sporulation protein R [bacterium]
MQHPMNYFFKPHSKYGTKSNQPKQYLILAALFFLIACWTFAIEERVGDETLANALSPNVLRFHILAASDSDEDQALKLDVRDFFLETLRAELFHRFPEIFPEMQTDGTKNASKADGEAVSGTGESKSAGKQELLTYIRQEKEYLEETVNAYIAQKGFSDTVSIQIATVHFPARTYGDMVFPCGNYEAVQLLIGPANGHNWWCVLYPSLCFTEETGPYLPESSCRQLEQMIGKDLYETLLSQKSSAPEITFFIRRLFPSNSQPEHPA